MDEPAAAHYIARDMNVVLLLSALLSAITGVNVGGARAPVAAEQVARANDVAAAALAFPAETVRPKQTVNHLAALLTVVPVVRQPAFSIPAFMGRRRE